MKRDEYDALWCPHCRKNDHSDAQCWSTRAVKLGEPCYPPAHAYAPVVPIPYTAIVHAIRGEHHEL